MPCHAHSIDNIDIVSFSYCECTSLLTWSRSPHDLVSCQGPPSPPLSLARCHCFAVTLDLRNTTCIATSQGACMERIHIRVIPGSFEFMLHLLGFAHCHFFYCRNHSLTRHPADFSVFILSLSRLNERDEGEGHGSRREKKLSCRIRRCCVFGPTLRC